jgi:hypothetical protein
MKQTPPAVQAAGILAQPRRKFAVGVIGLDMALKSCVTGVAKAPEMQHVSSEMRISTGARCGDT